MRRFRLDRIFIVLMVLVTFAAVGCKKNVPLPPAQAAPPPPPPPPPPAPTLTLSANPATIEAGQSSTLTWQSTNATTVTIQPELGAVPATGSRQVSPTSSVTYTATAVGPGGERGGVTARITVNVPAPPPPAAPAPSLPSVPLDQQFSQAMQPVLFDYDKSDIRGDQISKLQSMASWLKQNVAVRFTVDGHADERGSQEYNIALGDERSASVKQYLVSQGVTADRINTVSYGEERPVCRTMDEACYQTNRRAAFTMVR